MELAELYRRLDATYDVSNWWDAGTQWEVIVGAVLVQRTAWENVLLVLEGLKMRGLLTVEGIADVPQEELERILRPVGLYRQKARALQAVARYLRDLRSSDPSRILDQEVGTARKELLSLPGIGRETADVILLFAGHRPRFVAADYVIRTLGRAGVTRSRSYEEVHDEIVSALPRDPGTYAHLYALVVQHARSVCRARPRCGACCLRDVCPSVDH